MAGPEIVLNLKPVLLISTANLSAWKTGSSVAATPLSTTKNRLHWYPDQQDAT